jgi:hypothetical protein
MQWQIIVAIVLAVPVILFPIAFVWFLNIGGLSAAAREVRAKRTIEKPEKAKSLSK